MFEKLDGFFSGTDIIPNCAIATQLEHTRAKRQLENAQAKQAESKCIKAEKDELQRLLFESGNSNRGNNPSRSKDVEEDKSGPIIGSSASALAIFVMERLARGIRKAIAPASTTKTP
jgi:hypothetical protein